MEAEAERELAEWEAADSDPATTVVDRRKGGALRTTALLTGIVLVSLMLVGTGITFVRLAGRDFGDAERVGWATVGSCTEHGPITNQGFGYWDSCRVTIRWDDGTATRLINDGDFTATDVGRQVRVGYLGTEKYRVKLAREDTPARPWLTWIGVAVGIIGGLPLLIIGIMISLLLHRK
ncbi:DUF6346 domain-containing protein [Actinoplanes flavus]|uniref:DUF3592 domain-containing protein n=1 Tax=Actinoplanes flavus TaxID=2820290 RepID=A0ABS3UGI7_9ACTN|nr:DUF6346 domain-containing protein [Actinoplanes flavus]MBO3737895.1 hypothetical protein [Actinoplanes flavus]